MRTFTNAALLAGLLGCGAAMAQTSTTLCSPPQVPDCVVPQWGSIHPDDSDGLAAPSSTIAKAGGDRPTLVRVALSGDSRKVPPKIVVDDGKTFARETKSLLSAIKAARFDGDGKLVAGEERVVAALDRVNAVARNHQLVIYLKASPKLTDAKRTLLAREVEAMNAVLDKGSPRR